MDSSRSDDTNAAKKTLTLSAEVKAAHAKQVAQFIAAQQAARLALASSARDRTIRARRVMVEEFARVGIDMEKITKAFDLNAAEDAAEFSQLSLKGSFHRREGGRDLAPLLSQASAAPRSAASIGGTRTPPFDFAGISFQPPDPNPPADDPCPNLFDGSASCASASINGNMWYYVDTPIIAPAPSNMVANAFVGIYIEPPSEGALGIVQVNLTGSLSMAGSAGCNFSGIANTEGSVGWIVAEVDPNTGLIVGQPYKTYTEEYYIDVSFGGSGQQVPFAGSPFQNQLVFGTVPGFNYEIYAWIWGSVMANGNLGPWSSRAAGNAFLSVQAMTWTWRSWIF